MVVVSLASGALVLDLELFSGWVSHAVLVAGFVTALCLIGRNRERADTKSLELGQSTLSAGEPHRHDVLPETTAYRWLDRRRYAMWVAAFATVAVTEGRRWLTWMPFLVAFVLQWLVDGLESQRRSRRIDC